MTQVLATTVDPKDFTLGDWLKVAGQRDFKPRWALEAWLGVVDNDVLGALTLEDWEAIADAIEYSEGWAYHRYKEHRSTESNKAEVLTA